MKILVTGDVHRPGDRSGNILWLWNILKCRFPDAEVFLGSGDKWTEEEWRKAWKGDPHDGPPSEVATAGLGHVVMGFELPKRVKDELDQAGILWVDFIIHPVRFGPDVLFGVIDNNRILGTPYTANAEAVFQAWANLEMARWTRAPKAQNPFGMVVGQVDGDSSMIDFPGYENLDFPKEPKGLFRPHPYADKSKVTLNELFEMFGVQPGVKYPNIYQILSDDGLSWVGGWNSSVLYEAKFFGKTVIRHGPAWWDGYTPMNLSHVLGGPMPDGALRRTMHDKWGYEA